MPACRGARSSRTSTEAGLRVRPKLKDTRTALLCHFSKPFDPPIVTSTLTDTHIAQFTSRGLSGAVASLQGDVARAILTPLRQACCRVRVSAQLVDAESGGHLWADRFDCDRGDLFDLQNEITRRTAATVGSELVISEARRPTEPDRIGLHPKGTAPYSHFPDKH